MTVLEHRLLGLQSKLLSAPGGDRLLALIVGHLAAIPGAKDLLTPSHLSPAQHAAALAFTAGMVQLRDGRRRKGARP